MIETLYLTIVPGRWGQPRIKATSKHRPKRLPLQSVVVRLDVDLPRGMFSPLISTVKVPEESLRVPPVSTKLGLVVPNPSPGLPSPDTLGWPLPGGIT